MTNSLKSQSQFKDVYSELEYHKTHNQKQECEISKLQTQIQRLESSNKKLQENIAINGKNVNNTSISFFLPSEFTILWEKLIKTELLEALDSYIENFVLIAHLAQDIMLITYKQTDLLIKSKIDLILKSLNIKELTQEQKDKLLLKFQSFFQEHFAEIFISDKQLVTKIKEELKKISNSYVFNWSKESFKEEISKQQFDTMIMSVFKVCLYMLLHEPVLSLDIKEYNERKLKYLFFNKKDFINIEGFGNEKTPCVIILPPPMLRKKFPYSDLKAAVYSLYESNEEILAECERNQQEIKKPRSLAQTPIIYKIDTSGDMQSKFNDSPITPKLNTITKSIASNYGLGQNCAYVPIFKDKDKEKGGNNKKTQASTSNHIPIPVPTQTNPKKENDDLKAKRNYDQPLLLKSNTIMKQTPSIYSAKSFIPFNNQNSNQITKEISGEITPTKLNSYNKASTISGFNRNDQSREGDQLKSIHSMHNWNRKENWIKKDDPPLDTLSPVSLHEKIEAQKSSIYSIPSFNVIRSKNAYKSENSQSSLIKRPSKDNSQVSEYSTHETRHYQQHKPQQQQPLVKRQQRDDDRIKPDYYDNSLLSYTNYQYENSKQKEYNEPYKEYANDKNWNENNKHCKEISTKHYSKVSQIEQSQSNVVCGQRYNINQMKLDDLRYKYQLNDGKDSTPRGENLAKYALGDYYYKKKYKQ